MKPIRISRAAAKEVLAAMRAAASRQTLTRDDYIDREALMRSLWVELHARLGHLAGENTDDLLPATIIARALQRGAA